MPPSNVSAPSQLNPRGPSLWCADIDDTATRNPPIDFSSQFHVTLATVSNLVTGSADFWLHRFASFR